MNTLDACIYCRDWNHTIERTGYEWLRCPQQKVEITRMNSLLDKQLRCPAKIELHEWTSNGMEAAHFRECLSWASPGTSSSDSSFNLTSCCFVPITVDIFICPSMSARDIATTTIQTKVPMLWRRNTRNVHYTQWTTTKATHFPRIKGCWSDDPNTSDSKSTDSDE